MKKSNYFTNINTLEALKKEYRKLCKVYHPDLPTGNLAIMKFINNEYELLFEQLKHISTNKNDQAENVNTFKDIINQLIKFDINIEIVGSWIWLSGNTYSIKEEIKQLNFKWSKTRKKWYYSEGLTKKKKGSNLGFDDIRNAYGSQKIKSNQSKKYQIS